MLKVSQFVFGEKLDKAIFYDIIKAPSSHRRVISLQSCPSKVAMMFGSCAAGIYEPGQVGNKAALSRISWVTQGCLAELTMKVTSVI